MQQISGDEQLVLNWNFTLFGGILLLAGLAIGVMGFYGFSIFKSPVPDFLRLTHGILTFWSALMILTSFLGGVQGGGRIGKYLPQLWFALPLLAGGLLFAWGMGARVVAPLLIVVVIAVWGSLLWFTVSLFRSANAPAVGFVLYLRVGWLIILSSLATGIAMAVTFTLNGARPPVGLMTAHTHSFLYVLLMFGSIIILRLAGASRRISRLAVHLFIISAISSPVALSFFALGLASRTISLPFDAAVFGGILLVFLVLLGFESSKEKLRDLGVSRALLAMGFATFMITAAWGGWVVLAYEPGFASAYDLPRSPIRALETLHFSPLAFAMVSMAIALVLPRVSVSQSTKTFIVSLLGMGTALNMVGMVFTVVGFPPGALQVKTLGGIPLFGLGVLLFMFNLVRHGHLVQEEAPIQS